MLAFISCLGNDKIFGRVISEGWWYCKHWPELRSMLYSLESSTLSSGSLCSTFKWAITVGTDSCMALYLFRLGPPFLASVSSRARPESRLYLNNIRIFLLIITGPSVSLINYISPRTQYLLFLPWMGIIASARCFFVFSVGI